MLGKAKQKLVNWVYITEKWREKCETIWDILIIAGVHGRVYSFVAHALYHVCWKLSNTPPQTDTSPSLAAKCLTLRDGRAFVRVSATKLLEGQ